LRWRQWVEVLSPLKEVKAAALLMEVVASGRGGASAASRRPRLRRGGS
jgi:hypothetical protein